MTDVVKMIGMFLAFMALIFFILVVGGLTVLAAMYVIQQILIAIGAL